ncbi:hypothetical protein JCM1393_21780 [Clostridium carnis]
MNKSYKIMIISIVILVVIGIGIFSSLDYIKPIKNIRDVKSNEVITIGEEALYKFVKESLMDENGGIYTNFKDSISEGDITKGHNVLSESQGMLLNYYLYKNDSEEFKNNFKYIKENMMLKNGLISWRIEGKEPSEVSATIDDLRILKSLLIASVQFDSFTYRYNAMKISNGIYKKLITDGKLIDFEDNYGKSKLSTLCYQDLSAIKLLSSVNKKWDEVYKNSLNIINEGFISKELPLYKKYYDNENKRYDDEDNVETLLSMLVILNKIEALEDVKVSIDWIKENLKYKGYISNSYNISNNTESKIESTSIYAVIAKIAKEINDEELYNMAINKMNVFQVNNKESKIYGAFGEESREEVYSYDNLNALLALRSKWNK